MLFLALPNALQADHEAERLTLTQLSQELSRLELLIDRAEREKNPDAEVQFRYDWLRHDLEEVSSGIKSYLTASELTARPVKPLHGKYFE